MNFAKFNALILMLFFCSCRGVYFDPDFYVADSSSQSIVSERGDVILASDIRFDQYACMNIEKVKELKRLLMSKNIGSGNKIRVRQAYANLSERFDQIQIQQIVRKGF